jgi:hypothetical protein
MQTNEGGQNMRLSGREVENKRGGKDETRGREIQDTRGGLGVTLEHPAGIDVGGPCFPAHCA